MLQARRVAALPGRQPGCQFLQPAERAARLGQLRLARRRLRPGLQIRPRELAEQRTHLVARDGVRVAGLVRHRAWAPAAGGAAAFRFRCRVYNRGGPDMTGPTRRSEEHPSELQSIMRISYAVFCLKKKKDK